MEIPFPKKKSTCDRFTIKLINKHELQNLTKTYVSANVTKHFFCVVRIIIYP